MAKEITITTQAELDALPQSFEEFTYIYIKAHRIIIRGKRGNSSVEARENSSVEARENSSVVARGNSSVVAWENSSVEAWGNSSVEAWGNSSVVAWGNSSVEARENSSVEARGNSSVVARGNSSVVAWENSSVEALGNASVRLQSDFAAVSLFAFAVCWLLAKGRCIKKSKTATIIKPKIKTGLSGWLKNNAIKDSQEIILFKRISKDFKTQENTANETKWAIGATLTHPRWSPKDNECGAGKFHACSRPYFCDAFRDKPEDRYIAIAIKKQDLYAWPSADYPHKIAFRKGKVLYECDKLGKKLEVK